MKILHITSWYPSKQKPYEALWIKRQIEAIPPIHEQVVYHVAVTPAKRFGIEVFNQAGLNVLICKVPSDKWIVIEVVNFVLLFYYFAFKRIQRRYDVINFHIAYPQLVFWSILKRFVRKPVVVSEHWSAYHFNFGVAKRLPRAQRIFQQSVPFITVSESLCRDLRIFSGNSGLKCHLVPNVVDPLKYKYESRTIRRGSFFMLSQWKTPKRPNVVLKAFSRLLSTEKFGHCTLRIGGYGPLLTEMQGLVNTLGMSHQVQFLGPMEPVAIALQMNTCEAFLHSSEYETFSVVCAEALCCGAPVIASKVGGLCEFVDESNGILVENDSEEEWLVTLQEFNQASFDRRQISVSAIDRFAPMKVGVEYMNVLEAVCYDKK